MLRGDEPRASLLATVSASRDFRAGYALDVAGSRGFRSDWGDADQAINSVAITIHGEAV